MASNFKPRYAVFQKEKKKAVDRHGTLCCRANSSKLCLKYEIPTSCLKNGPQCAHVFAFLHY